MQYINFNNPSLITVHIIKSAVSRYCGNFTAHSFCFKRSAIVSEFCSKRSICSLSECAVSCSKNCFTKLNKDRPTDVNFFIHCSKCFEC